MTSRRPCQEENEPRSIAVLTAPFGRELPSNLVKYFAIAAQFFMLFLTVAFFKPYTSSGRTATVVYKVPHNYSEHLGYNNTTLKLLLLCFRNVFGIGNINNCLR